jgi:hypothetical protein
MIIYFHKKDAQNQNAVAVFHDFLQTNLGPDAEDALEGKSGNKKLKALEKVVDKTSYKCMSLNTNF